MAVRTRQSLLFAVMIAVVIALFAHQANPAPAAVSTIPITVLVKTLEATDNGLESDADLYTILRVGNVDADGKVIDQAKYGTFSTFDVHVDDEDFVVVNARFTANVPSDSERVVVSFEGWDHDAPDPDDLGDISPDPNFNAFADFFNVTKGFIDNCTEGNTDKRIRLCYEIWSFEPGLDSDSDGLLDRWETGGLDVNGDGIVDVNLPAMGARWDHADVFLELDYEAGQVPNRESIQAMKKAFAAASVFNPDGRTGIRLWVDTGGLIDPTAREGQAQGTCLDGIDNGGSGSTDASDPDCTDTTPVRRYLETSTEDPLPGNCNDGIDNDGVNGADGADPSCLVGDNLGGGNMLGTVGACGLDAAFYAAKNGPGGLDRDRRWVFRYGISAAQPAVKPVGPCDKATGGQGEVGGNDFIEFNHDGGTVMHELGHTLNLDHGGDSGANCKPNYVSVMNYDNQFGIRRVGGGVILDYSMPRRTLSGFDLFGGLPPGVISRGPVPGPLVETDLDDTTIIDPNDHVNRFVFVNGKGNKDNGRLDQKIDWGDDDAGDPDDLNQMFNVDTGTPNPTDCQNNMTSSTPMTGFNDWLRVSLSMNLRPFGDARDGAINPSPDISPTRAELVELEKRILRSDISTTVSGSPDPVAAGTDLTYSLTVKNAGSDPSGPVTAKATLSADLQFVSASAGCSHVAGVVTCVIAGIGVGGEVALSVVTHVPADLVYLNGAPKLVTTTARADGALEDPAPANNVSSSTVKAIAVAGLGIASPSTSGVPAELLIGVPTPVVVSFSASNAGPSTPMDATLTVSATSSAGGAVSPASQALAVVALAKGVDQKPSATVNVSCLLPGIQTFTVQGTIKPTRPDDIDPNAANNSASTAFTVECVLPIAINIRPGNAGNVYDLNTDALPVALLSTRAGEYGLPLDFDATRADVASLRFGQRALVFANLAGSMEHQQKVQLVDSFELDERTKDGDADMRAQFARANTRLMAADTEACVKGIYTAPSGARYKFFGCDAINVVP